MIEKIFICWAYWTPSSTGRHCLLNHKMHSNYWFLNKLLQTIIDTEVILQIDDLSMFLKKNMHSFVRDSSFSYFWLFWHFLAIFGPSTALKGSVLIQMWNIFTGRNKINNSGQLLKILCILFPCFSIFLVFGLFGPFWAIFGPCTTPRVLLLVNSDTGFLVTS